MAKEQKKVEKKQAKVDKKEAKKAAKETKKNAKINSKLAKWENRLEAADRSSAQASHSNDSCQPGPDTTHTMSNRRQSEPPARTGSQQRVMSDGGDRAEPTRPSRVLGDEPSQVQVEAHVMLSSARSRLSSGQGQGKGKGQGKGQYKATLQRPSSSQQQQRPYSDQGNLGSITSAEYQQRNRGPVLDISASEVRRLSPDLRRVNHISCFMG